MPTDVFLCPASLISSPVNTFASNSIQNEGSIHGQTTKKSRGYLFVPSHINDIKRQPVSIRTQNMLLN